MSATDTRNWTRVGLVALPIAGALTLWSSLDPQPDPNVRYEAWSRFVVADHYVITHVFGSILGLILAIFGSFALGAYLASSRAGRMGMAAMVLTVFGTALFLPGMGVSAFAAPKEGQAFLAGIEEYAKLPDILSDTMGAMTALLMVVLIFVGNLLLGFAVWRSGALPRWAGAAWAAAAVLMYPMGLVYEATIGPASTPPTVWAGAALMVVGGGWIALSTIRRPSAKVAGAAAQPSA
jgi:small-conductance mechanosensitive channel